MTIWIDPDKCDGCQRCIRACIYGAIELREGKAFILDRCTSCGACLDECRQGALFSDIRPREIPDFSDYKGVWVFAEQRGGELNPVVPELLGKAGDLAADLDQEVAAVVLGHDVAGISDTLIAHGADIVYLAEHGVLRDFRTEPYAAVIADLIRQFKPSILLMGASHIGRDLAPRISRRVVVGLTADCTDLVIDPDEKILWQTRPAFGGNVMATIANRYSRPQMATVRPGVMEPKPVPGAKGRIIRHEVVLAEYAVRTQILEKIREKPSGVDLAKAGVIVAGGRGVGDKAGFDVLRELAEVMGGEVAGTRVAVEQGWIEPENQVGQTGRTVRPEIYVACGISGAVQHRAGMMNSRYIIAINTDPRAPIFQVADWGIVGDLFDVVPEMIRQLKAEA